ncbi:Asp23/Gls24 family envelope stress response protein [Fundicoccus culcitae]|uniref:Asp23/Gls24 family envelope stress response protein n=1 Tax=Fundicoccus culcitae TaxID=2969821 RepID=A0ABY5P688_9LACT|nr:Asp23/Gls24 family envelope stress response protein [Fundicoccus culcitae]UUX34236.1 Asp23/Gls24 family envelope stress response protein [Fundicoccus culcitae]
MPKSNTTPFEMDQNPAGEINITLSVLETIAAKAASEVEGVNKMHSSFQKEVGGFFGMDRERMGATVKRDGNNLSIDVQIHLQYGYSVPDVAFKVQERVKEQILFMTDLVVQEVNVHVVSIDTNPNRETAYLNLDDELGE